MAGFERPIARASGPYRDHGRPQHYAQAGDHEGELVLGHCCSCLIVTGASRRTDNGEPAVRIASERSPAATAAVPAPAPAAPPRMAPFRPPIMPPMIAPPTAPPPILAADSRAGESPSRTTESTRTVSRVPSARTSV